MNKVVARAFLRVEHQLRHHRSLRGEGDFLGVGEDQCGGVYGSVINSVVL